MCWWAYLIADVHISDGCLQIANDGVYDGLQPAASIFLCFMAECTLTLQRGIALRCACQSMQPINSKLQLACVATSSASATRWRLACCSASSKSYAAICLLTGFCGCAMEVSCLCYLILSLVSLLKLLLGAGQEVKSVELNKHGCATQTRPRYLQS